MGGGKRITYLDMAKGVGIVLMVTGHLFGSLQNIDYKPYFSTVYQVIASFHMPLFFVISGIVLGLTGEDGKDMGQIVHKKAVTLLLPYATFSLIYTAMNVFTYFFEPELIELSFLLKTLVYTVTFHGISVLWFLPTLFFGELLFLWVRKRADDKRTVLLFCATGTAMLLLSPVFRWEGWDGSLWMVAAGSLLQVAARSVLCGTFLMLGYYAWRFLKVREERSVVEFVVGVLLLILTCILCFQNELVDLNYMVFGNIILYMICACAGSFGVLLICRNVWQSRLLIFYGVNSLVIMATHMEFKIMMHSIQFSYWFNQFVTRAKEWVLFGTIALYITLAEIIVIFLYNRLFYFLIGKKKPQRKRG